MIRPCYEKLRHVKTCSLLPTYKLYFPSNIVIFFSFNHATILKQILGLSFLGMMENGNAYCDMIRDKNTDFGKVL